MTRRCRFIYFHPDANAGKTAKVEALAVEYRKYLAACVGWMVESRVWSLPMSQMRTRMPTASAITSQVAKNARIHAVDMVSKWFKSTYTLRVRPEIAAAQRLGVISDAEAKALRVVGKFAISSPWKSVTQTHIDLYNQMLAMLPGDTPTVRESEGMRLSEKTGHLLAPKRAKQGTYWLRASTLTPRKTVQIPLSGNPYVERVGLPGMARSFTVCKDRRGRWRVEVCEKQKYAGPVEAEPGMPRVGIDVGLNVLAADSEGILYGEHFKARFDRLWGRIKRLRAERQRQGLRENSARLSRLEARLSGMVKSFCGRISNLLVKRYPDTVFVIEDLDLRGCKGQKRFAYRMLAAMLEAKAPTEKINPAYTSQTCPSCGHVHRGNRNGTKFACRVCGRVAHADVVGAVNVLRRSEDQDIDRHTHPSAVRKVLETRYRQRRDSAPSPHRAPPLGRSSPQGDAKSTMQSLYMV